MAEREDDIRYGQALSRGFLAALDRDQSEVDSRMREHGEQIARELAKHLGQQQQKP